MKLILSFFYFIKIFIYGQLCGCNFLLKKIPFIGWLFIPFDIFAIFSLKFSKEKRIRMLFLKLGPTFIKLGQLLSTRSDLVGNDIANELAFLQDKLPSFKYKYVQDTIRKELGDEIENLFIKFDKNPVAAASISQVHYAITNDKKKVAVKILRPKIAKIFFREINVLYFIASFISFFKIAKRLKLKEVIRIFEEATKKELDLRLEAASASCLKENLAGDKNIYIPKIYWHLTEKKVLTLEWLDGIKISDTKKLKKAGFSLSELAENLIYCYFNQAYQNGFFHADMHPGNILITKQGKIAFIDFGIMGYLSKKDKIYVTKILYGFIKKDYDEIAELHLLAGYVPKDTNLKDFSLACRAVIEPIFGLPVKSFSIAKMLAHLFQVTEKFGMETQPQLLLLQKTLFTVEGVTANLDRDINIWQIGEPWMRHWANNNLSYQEKAKDIVQELKKLGEKLPEIMDKLIDKLHKVS